MSNLHLQNDSIDAGSVYDSKLEMTQEEINESLSGTAIENLVKYPYVKNSYSNTSGTLTGTVNADGSVTINGETQITGNTNFDLNDSRNCATLQPGTYVLSGASANVALSVHYIQQDDSAWSADVLNFADGSKVYTFDKVTKFRIATRVTGAKTISAETLYPMLEIGNVAHDFVPPGEPSSSLFVRVANLEKAVGSGIPVYWENYLADKITAIQKAQEDSGLSGDSFVFLTDYHYTFNAQNSPALIRRILEACGIGKVFFAGDLINHNDAITSKDEVLADITSALDTLTSGVMEHCFAVDGNHEHHMPGYPAYDPGHAVLYSMLAKRQELHIGWVDSYGSYWVDNVPQKIRYFFLSCEANAVTTAEAGASVAAELANVPAGYTVVLVTHHAISGDPAVPVSSGGVPAVLTALQTLASGGSVDVACVLAGHVHRDRSNTTAYDFPIIVTTTDASGKSTAEDQLVMTRGTTTEQAFDVVILDTENKSVKMIRIGAGEDREFSYGS